MKKIFLITALFFVNTSSFCQITCPLGSFVPLANVNLSNLDYSFRDVGTNIYINEYFYSNTSYRISAVFRKNGYWYIVDDFYTGSYTYSTPNIGSSKIRARSVYKNLTIDPPCSSNWFIYDANSSLTVTWLPPFSTLPEVNSSYNNVGFIISGTSCSSNLYDFAGINTTPSLHPNYIDLPKRDEMQLNLESPSAGKLTYNLPNQALLVGNKVSWDKVLFDKKDINMTPTTKINFGDETTSIFVGNPKEIRVKSNQFLFSDTFTGLSYNNDHKIMALNQGDPVIYGGYGAPIEFFKSHATPLTTFSGSITVNDKNDVLVYIGTTSTAIITLPYAGQAIRRHYTLTNHGNNVSISISPALKNGFSSTISTLPAGQSFIIASDGVNWRLISRSTL
jgi:hypothetical protein